MNRWVWLLLCAPLASGAEMGEYRGFRFGATLEVTAKQAGAKVADARIRYRRPAVVTELDWEPKNAATTDPVRDGLLRFCDGELFQIVTTYDRQRVEGMGTEEMVAAISLTYGMATKPGGEIRYRSNYGETAEVLARWENTGYVYDLVRTGDRTSFALILSDRRRARVAAAAMAESARMDLAEAPQRALALEKKMEAERETLLEKARLQNTPHFKP